MLRPTSNEGSAVRDGRAGSLLRTSTGGRKSCNLRLMQSHDSYKAERLCMYSSHTPPPTLSRLLDLYIVGCLLIFHTPVLFASRSHIALIAFYALGKLAGIITLLCAQLPSEKRLHHGGIPIFSYRIFAPFGRYYRGSPYTYPYPPTFIPPCSPKSVFIRFVHIEIGFTTSDNPKYGCLEIWSTTYRQRYRKRGTARTLTRHSSLELMEPRTAYSAYQTLR